MKSRLHRLLTLLAAASLSLSAGCASKTTATTESSKTSSNETTVQSIGSWIPRKVKKKSDILGDSTGEADKSVLQQAITKGNTRVIADPEQGRR